MPLTLLPAPPPSGFKKLPTPLVSVIDNLCTKQGNSSIFGSKIRGFKSRAGYNGARTVYQY